MADLDPLLRLAQRVATEADALGIQTALIGALALAHYGYVRATVDVDLAASTPFDTKLRMLADRLIALGLVVELRAPDDDDPLDGVLRVREGPDGDPVDIINFRAGDSLGAWVVTRAVRAPNGFTYARPPELIALKLYAGSRFDRDDVARLLSENPTIDLDEVRRVCAEAGVGGPLDEVLREMAR